jgi:hypothetical protein
MKKYILFFLLTVNCIGEEISAEKVNKIVSAIYKIEGGERARVPYGILGVKVKNKAEARQVCENTVRNNWKRWEKAGRRGLFLDFLANVYCPTIGKNLSEFEKKCNNNWKPNLRKVLGSDFYDSLK